MAGFARRFGTALARVGPALLLAAAGCSDPQGSSQDNMQRIGLSVHEYVDKYGSPPKSLDQLVEFFASRGEFERTMRNPLTGDDPGYLYARPPAGVIESSLAYRVVMLYQLRGGQKAEDLPVGYAAGATADLLPGAITDTDPRWQQVKLSEAGLSVMLPADSKREKADPARISVTAAFCGLDYTVDCSQSRAARTAAMLGPQAILRTVRDALASGLGARLAASQEVRLGRYPGLAATLELHDQDQELRVRWFLVEDRLVRLSVVGPRGALNDENAGKFFASLKLLAREGP